MTNPIPQPVWQVIDQNGEPISGASIYTYIPGTLTSKASYADFQQLTQNPNPVTTDSSGRTPAMWGFGGYRVIVKDANGNLIYDQITRTGLPEASVSDVMLPVVGAATLATARTLMGIDTEIQNSITSIVSTMIATEAGARAAADAAETAARAAADKVIEDAIGVVNSSLATNVASLQAQINTLNGQVAGLGTSGGALSLQTGSGVTDDWGNLIINYTPFPHALWQFTITPVSDLDSFFFYPFWWNLGLGIYTAVSQTNGQAQGSASHTDPFTGLQDTVPNVSFTWFAVGY